MRFRPTMHLAKSSAAVLLFATVLNAGPANTQAADMKIPVTFSGGHEIRKDDYGRPVPLIATALAVEPEVFRKAFSGVTPARGRGPSRDEARKNKEALLKVLSPHGVTNERLDEVSDYYRFRPQAGELWPTTAAKAHAIVEDGKIKKIVVTAPGAGYCSPPAIKVKGFKEVELKATLEFSKELKKNGGISAVEILPAKPAK